MASRWPAVMTDWETAIKTAWPEVTQIELASDLEKFDWQELDRETNPELVPPWVIIYVTQWQPWPGRPMNQVWYQGPVTFIYLQDDQAVTDIVSTLMDRMEAMENELQTASFTGMQVLGNYQQNWGPNNMVNPRLEAQKLPLTAGEFTFDCLVPGVNVP